ncbi:MAG TPA: hypothetical protein VFI54_26100 [Solirubrobacteraceae bacterium]|nr:hypothetical protein [Solirubrobacteraceae bacterium]
MHDAAEPEGLQDAAPAADVEAATRAAALRVALARYETTGAPAMLDQAFVAAAAAVAALRGERAAEPADVEELRGLVEQLPEFRELVGTVVGEAERWAHAGAAELWSWFGLTTEAPGWSDAEQSGARLLVARACAPLEADGVDWLRARMLRLAAERWAAQLTGELCESDEDLWRRVFGERYDLIRTRYAPRTAWRKRELSKVLATDASTVDAIRRRLAAWFVQSRDLEHLPTELEAAFVETRTPSRLA